MQAANHTSDQLRDDLRQLFAKAKLPSSPDLAARILGLIDDPRATAEDFGKAIRTDPALSSRLLQTANAAHYGQRVSVTTIERAVTVLGLNRVKAISLGFQLVGHLDRLGGVPFDMKQFWHHSLLRACLARSIAEDIVPTRKEEAFLIGLLQDCGVLLVVQVLGCSYSRLCQSGLSPTAFHAVEKESFPYTHIDAIAAMTTEWNLPDIIAVPIELHHRHPTLTDSSAEIERLCAVAYFVGALRFTGPEEGRPDDATWHSPDSMTRALTRAHWAREEEGLRDFGAISLGLSDGHWSDVQQNAQEEFSRVATLYAEVLPDEVDTTELLSEANRYLACVVDEADQRVIEAECARTAVQDEQQQLQSALRDYRERAAADPLTNVANRGALIDAARLAIERNRDEGHPLGMLFLDIDDFRALNTKYGRATGDKVLKIIAGKLDTAVSEQGVVGRYGGEEFVIVLAEASPDQVLELGEAVVELVRDIDTALLDVDGAITCSVGAFWSDGRGITSAEELIAKADALMYQAKRAGKDRCSFCAEPASGLGETGSDPRERSSDASTTRDASSNTDYVAVTKLIAVAKRLNQRDSVDYVGIRKQARNPVEVPCTLHYFAKFGHEMRTESAATRTVSTGGAGLLVARPMVRGEAVEVVLTHGREKLYLAGLVSFCRHVEDGIHEVGVQFVSHSVRPVICDNPAEALERLNWVATALEKIRAAAEV